MSQTENPAPTKVMPRHYQALCGLALAAIALVQYQHSTRVNASLSLVYVVLPLVVFVGAVGIIFRVRFSPMLVLVAMALPQVIELSTTRQNLNPSRPMRILDIGDMIICMAGLVFFIGHYRLHGLWFGVLPADARQSAAKEAPPNVRSAESLTSAEMLALIFIVPSFALAAQFAWLLLQQRWGVLDLPPEWKQFLFVAWSVLLAMFLAVQGFGHWRRLQMDRATAQVMLQDVLWNETRGEQRKIHRWLAWMKLRQRNKK